MLFFAPGTHAVVFTSWQLSSLSLVSLSETLLRSRCCDTPHEARHHICHLSIYLSLLLSLSASPSLAKDFVPRFVYSMMTLDRLIPQQEPPALNVSPHI